MTQDLNKGISSISYNLLNLPSQVDILSPVGEARNTYVYAADGTKLQVVKQYNSNYNSSPIIGSAINTSNLDVIKITDYVGNMIFENNSLDCILVDGGYIKDDTYYFYETDHLGDNRTVVNQSGTVVERNDYYPYGMQMAHNELTNTSSDNKYKYNGKELDVMHGLNLYDYSARSQDPTLGRFTSVDPLAEKYYSISPYAYCGNNPLFFIDPDGRGLKEAWQHFKKSVSVSFSLGFQVGFKLNLNKKGVSGKLNMISMEFGGLENGKKTLNVANPSLSKEGSLQVGLLGGSFKQEAKDKGNGQAEKTTTVSANAAFVTVENKETTDYEKNSNGTYTKTGSKNETSVKTTETGGIVTSGGVALGLGVEGKINWDEAAKVLSEILKTITDTDKKNNKDKDKN